MKHLNNNLICAIDVETTHGDHTIGDVVEIAIVPLDYSLNISRKHKIFEMKMMPRRPENINWDAIEKQIRVDVDQPVIRRKKVMLDYLMTGIDPYKAADLFFEWWEKLQLPPYKKIIPLAQNWPFDKFFIQDWLGQETYDLCISHLFRDTQVTAMFRNDVADLKGAFYPYNHQNLTWLCKVHKIERARAHRALDDAVATAQLYKAMVYDAL